MANSKYLRWLNEDDLTTRIARRFVAFCDEEVEQRAAAPNFDPGIYEDAVRLVLDRLEGKNSKATQGEGEA